RSLADAVRQVRDPLAGARRAGGRFGDAGQILDPVRRALDDVSQVAANALEQLRRAVQGPPRVLGGLAHVAGLAAALLGELVDLVGHHREAAAMYAGAGRLDGRVERQQVRLVRDETDRFGELLDLLRHVPQAAHFAGALLRGHAEVGQAAHRRLRGEPDLLRRLLHLRARRSGLVARGSDLARALC